MVSEAVSIPGVLPGVMIPGVVPGMPGAFAGASRIVVLKNSVEIDELRDDNEYEEIMQDMQVGGHAEAGATNSSTRAKSTILGLRISCYHVCGPFNCMRFPDFLYLRVRMIMLLSVHKQRASGAMRQLLYLKA